MPYLILVCLLLCSTLASADSFDLGPVAVELPVGANLSKQRNEADKAGHLIPLGALEKVNHQLEPEASDLVFALRASWTWSLPFARSTDQVSKALRTQLKQSAEELYQCDGRSCGSSSYWANSIFNQSVLYGPEQFQRYAVYRLADPGSHLMLYVAQRATGEIFLHIELIAG